MNMKNYCNNCGKELGTGGELAHNCLSKPKQQVKADEAAKHVYSLHTGQCECGEYLDLEAMTKKSTQEEKVIALYEAVATMTITPSHARVRFMELLSQARKEGAIDMLEKVFKALVREEGHPIDKEFPIEEWEQIYLSEVDDVLYRLKHEMEEK